jgi:uncharacterized phage-associated protein
MIDQASKAYPAIAVVNYFIERGAHEGIKLSPMKLQKLVYFAHGWFLAVTGKPLIEESVEVWKYGPVIRKVYHELKHHGSSPVVTPIETTEYAFTRQPDGTADFVVTTAVPVLPPRSEDTARLYAVLDRVWDIYKQFTAKQLSDMTHEKGSPWERTVERNGGRIIMSQDISQEDI